MKLKNQGLNIKINKIIYFYLQNPQKQKLSNWQFLSEKNVSFKEVSTSPGLALIGACSSVAVSPSSSSFFSSSKGKVINNDKSPNARNTAFKITKYFGTLFPTIFEYNPVWEFALSLSGLIMRKSAKGVNIEELIPAPPKIIPLTNPWFLGKYFQLFFK